MSDRLRLESVATLVWNTHVLSKSTLKRLLTLSRDPSKVGLLNQNFSGQLVINCEVQGFARTLNVEFSVGYHSPKRLKTLRPHFVSDAYKVDPIVQPLRFLYC